MSGVSAAVTVDNKLDHVGVIEPWLFPANEFSLGILFFVLPSA
jgi:hypothetical protein